MDSTLKPFYEQAKAGYELKELDRLGLTPTLDQRNQILLYIALLLKWNKAAGLISPRDEEKVFIRHFCDSLQPLLLFGFRKNGSVLDIGAGGGFPSIPINIFRPDLRMILSESNKKKSSFLNEVKGIVKLENIQVFPDRCEKLQGRKYDYVVSRGYASLVHFSKTAKNFLMEDGKMYTFKARQFAEELEQITSNRLKDGVKISEIAEYDLANQIQGLNLVSLSLCK